MDSEKNCLEQLLINILFVSKKFRIIPKLDVKSSYIIKGVNFEGMRKIGSAKKFAKKYYLDGADELIINDVNASLFGRSTALNFLKSCCKDIFIPVTLAGGLKSVEDVKKAMDSGADKVAINTAAVKNKSIISKIVKIFGSQALIISINAKKVSDNKWQVYIDKGREKTGIDAIKWAKIAENEGAGEIHINSIDQEGTLSGFDYELIRAISKKITIPLIAGGGLGKSEDIKKLTKIKDIDGISTSAALHYNYLKIKQIKNQLIKDKIDIRK